MKSSQQIILEELERVNTDKKVFKTIFDMGEEIVTGHEFDLPIRGSIVVTKKKKSEFLAYVISRCTMHQFYCEKIHFKQFEQDYEFVKGSVNKVRNDSIIYDTMPLNAFQVQCILMLSGSKKHNLTAWFEIFEKMIRYIKIGPKSINGKPIEETEKLLSLNPVQNGS